VSFTKPIIFLLLLSAFCFAGNFFGDYLDELYRVEVGEEGNSWYEDNVSLYSWGFILWIYFSYKILKKRGEWVGKFFGICGSTALFVLLMIYMRNVWEFLGWLFNAALIMAGIYIVFTLVRERLPSARKDG